MKIYTGQGDQGNTGLFGGQRTRKSAPRVEAYGTIDELNSLLGVARSFLQQGELHELLTRLQHELFQLGADLATPPNTRASAQSRIRRVTQEDVERLETTIDQWEEKLPPLRSFILPGGHPAAAHLHLARSLCRRAERRVVAAIDAGEDISGPVLVYLNRLSDLLFVLARVINMEEGVAETAWNPARP